MPYTFRKTKKGIVATKINGEKIVFHTQSMKEARHRARIRESYAHGK
jgi:hypothetical protein